MEDAIPVAETDQHVERPSTTRISSNPEWV